MDTKGTGHRPVPHTYQTLNRRPVPLTAKIS